jgi:hypothetical protein
MSDPVDPASIDLADIDCDSSPPPVDWSPDDVDADPDPGDVLDLDEEPDA